MAAIHTWIGGTSGNMTTGSNLSDGVAVAAGDTVYFDGSAVQAPTTFPAGTLAWTGIVDKSYTLGIGGVVAGVATPMITDGGTLRMPRAFIGSPTGSNAILWNFNGATASVSLSAGELTSSGTTATVSHTSHGFSTGDYILIGSASQPEYNGLYKITVTNANVFTYVFVGSSTSPATTAGTITAKKKTLGTVVIEDTCANSAETSIYPPVQLEGALDLTITGGQVGIGIRSGQYAVINSIRTENGVGSPVVLIGTNVPIVDGVLAAGSITNRSCLPVTALRIAGASYEVNTISTAPHTLINGDSGKILYNGTGAIAAAVLKGGCAFDGSKDTRAKILTLLSTYDCSADFNNGVPAGWTLTNIKAYNGINIPGGCQLKFPPQVMINPILLA